MPGLSPARLCAARTLMEVQTGRHAEYGLTQWAPESPEDRGLARHLVLGVLRRRGQLDAVVGEHARKRVSREARMALHIGLVELHFSRTPAHAAVDQAVQLTKVLGRKHQSGFVNAILRKAQGRALPDVPNHAPWIVERWRGRYPGADAWLSRLDTEAPLALATKTSASPHPDARPATAGGHVVPRSWHLDRAGRVEQIEGYDAGDWWVMDPAAAMAADLLEAQPGERVLDACAAPGGKTMRLAALGAQVTACDKSAGRLRRLQENLDRTRLSATVVKQDWTKKGWDGEAFGAILLDAPCTSLGTTRRHPEVRWNRSATDPLAMAVLQDRVIDGVVTALANQGRLVYAVCSPEPEEGPERVRAAVERHGLVLETEVCTAPPSGDEDAFYAARLRRG